ncbi:MAG: hypothetical protein NT154_16135 [Verrucomicrobia bacterium]|nr:hypothetical protein [Verrucomicrobiota bacterium]
MTSLLPFAEEATDFQPWPEIPAGVQLAPELVERYTGPVGESYPAITNLVPSADEATQLQDPEGALAGVQVAPEFVDSYTAPLG